MRASEFITEAIDPKENDPAIIKDIKDAFDAGYTPDDTAKLVGLPYASVKRVLKTHYSDRVRPSKYTDELAAIKAEWDKGLKPGQIATQLGIPREKVTYLLMRLYPDRENKRVEVHNRIEDMSSDDKDAAIKSWQQGSSINAIAKVYNINHHLMAKVIANAVGQDAIDDRNNSLGINKTVITAADIPNIVKMYQDNVPVAQIAKQYNVAGNNIKYHLMKQGIFNPKKTARSLEIDSPDVDKIINMHLSGFAAPTIAKKTGLSIGKVRYHLMMHGA